MNWAWRRIARANRSQSQHSHSTVTAQSPSQRRIASGPISMRRYETYHQERAMAEGKSEGGKGTKFPSVPYRTRASPYIRQPPAPIRYTRDVTATLAPQCRSYLVGVVTQPFSVYVHAARVSAERHSTFYFFVIRRGIVSVTYSYRRTAQEIAREMVRIKPKPKIQA